MENGTCINHIDKDKVCFYNKEKLIRPKQFYYWNPSLIMLSCNKEQYECEIFGNNYYRYVPAQYSFEIRLNNTDAWFSNTDFDMTSILELCNTTFTGHTLKSCINRLITEAYDIERHYQDLKNEILKKQERILFERDSILRKNHYEDNVISSNLYNDFLIQEKHMAVIERIEEFMKALYKEVDALNKEIKEGKLIGYNVGD